MAYPEHPATLGIDPADPLYQQMLAEFEATKPIEEVVSAPLQTSEVIQSSVPTSSTSSTTTLPKSVLEEVYTGRPRTSSTAVEQAPLSTSTASTSSTAPNKIEMPSVIGETKIDSKPLEQQKEVPLGLQGLDIGLTKTKGTTLGLTELENEKNEFKPVEVPDIEQSEMSVAQTPVDPLVSLEQKIQSKLDEFANSSLEFKTPKTDAAMKALRESISREMQAITSTGELGKQEAILRQKALDDQNIQQREIQMLVDQEAKAREAKYNEYMEAKNIKLATFRNSKVDPERYFKNQTTGQTAARIIGTILGGIGAGMLKSTSNPVLAIVDGFIERDIQAQQAELNVQREDINQLDSAYAEGLKAFRDVSSAKMLAKRVGLDMIERALESKVVGLKGDNAIQQANVAREQLQRQMEMIDLDLGKRLDMMAFEQARKEREAQMLQLKEVQSSLFLAKQNPESAQLEAHLAKLPALVVDKKTREAARAELGDIQLANSAAQEVVREFSELKDKGWRWNLLDRATQTKLKVAYPKIFSRVKNMIGSASSFSDGDRKALVDVYQPGAFDFDDTIGEKMKGLVEFLLLDRQPNLKRIGFTPRGRVRSYDLVTPLSKKNEGETSEQQKKSERLKLPDLDTTATSTSVGKPFTAKKYEPFSQEAKTLFRNAAKKAGLPEEWAESEGLHKILKAESAGWVGRPNYTYGEKASLDNSSKWNEIHDEIRKGQKSTRSTATGLGQLTMDNVDKYYPSGRAGIGDPEEEAIGTLKYIKDRYSDPNNAWAKYGVEHEGY